MEECRLCANKLRLSSCEKCATKVCEDCVKSKVFPETCILCLPTRRTRHTRSLQDCAQDDQVKQLKEILSGVQNSTGSVKVKKVIELVEFLNKVRTWSTADTTKDQRFFRCVIAGKLRAISRTVNDQWCTKQSVTDPETLHAARRAAVTAARILHFFTWGSIHWGAKLIRMD